MLSADLGMQRLDAGAGLGFAGSAAIEGIGGALQQLPLPVGDPVRPDFKMFRDLRSALSPQITANATLALNATEGLRRVLLV
jgi:hypothetical protein